MPIAERIQIIKDTVYSKVPDPPVSPFEGFAAHQECKAKMGALRIKVQSEAAVQISALNTQLAADWAAIDAQIAAIDAALAQEVN